MNSATFNKEDYIANEIKRFVNKNTYLTRGDFLKVCNWKSPRPRRHFEKNDADMIKEVSQIALTTKSDRLRAEIWRTLHGVSWPMASVFLHWFHHDRYPRIDFRALWSLSHESTNYNFDLWLEYTEFCRKLADKSKVDMRTLDRALWQYSKVNQK